MEISLKRIIGITLTSFLVGAIGSCTLVYNPKPYKITESIIEDKKYLIIHYIDNFSPKEVIESDQIFTQQQDGRFYRWNLVK